MLGNDSEGKIPIKNLFLSEDSLWYEWFHAH